MSNEQAEVPVVARSVKLAGIDALEDDLLGQGDHSRSLAASSSAQVNTEFVFAA
jgi:hypothetical protein